MAILSKGPIYQEIGLINRKFKRLLYWIDVKFDFKRFRWFQLQNSDNSAPICSKTLFIVDAEKTKGRV